MPTIPNATDEAVAAALLTVSGLGDAEAAAALSLPGRLALPPLTYRNLANRVGLMVAGAFTEAVVGASASSSPDPQAVSLRRLALLCERVLSNDGLDPEAEQTPAVVAMVIEAGWLTSAQATAALWAPLYQCGGIVAAEQVARVRAAAAAREAAAVRTAAFEALRLRIAQAAASVSNELVSVAGNDPPPPWEQVAAAFAAFQAGTPPGAP